MLENNKIKYKTETTGFLLIIINTPDNNDNNMIKFKNSMKNPLKVSDKR